MIEIAQIGTIPIRISQGNPLYQEDVRPIGDPEPMLSDGNVLFPDNQYGLKLSEREIKGVISRMRDFDPYALYQSIKNMVGKPTHIIGIYGLPYNGTDVDGIWLQTRGRIERVRLKPDKKMMGEYKITIEVSLMGSWKPLNRLIYEYVDYDDSALTVGTTPVSPSIALITPYPTYEEYIGEFNYLRLMYWRPREEHFNLMYDPDFWDLVVDYLPQWFESIGLFQDWTLDSFLVTLWSDTSLWNYRPQMVWAFKGLETLYDPTITIYRDTANGGTENILIDTSLIDTILTADTATGLQTTDVLLLGDVQGKAVVIRNNLIVSYVSSALGVYKGESPAFIPILEHVEYQVEFDRNSQIEWANLLQWRMMV